jgi:group I intron endonuclease
MGFIYVLTNKINGKRYIGQTRKDLFKRLYAHRHSSYLIGKAIAKYGWENFLVESFEYPDEKLNEMEQKFISDYESLNPKGYNLDLGGKNFIRSEETKLHCSLSVRGEKHRNWGKHLSEETRSKISASLMGRKRPIEVCLKMSASHKGKPLTPEQNKKIHDAKRGVPFTEDHKRKISEALTGKKRGHLSEDHKKKLAEAMKRFWGTA